jgi:hypothetical protein
LSVSRSKGHDEHLPVPHDPNSGWKTPKGKFGFVTNMRFHMAESPKLLAGYAALWDLFAKSTLTPHEQQVVTLTTNFENNLSLLHGGAYTLAQMINMVPAVIAALREGRPLPDPKLEALHRFTTIIVRKRGFASDADVQAFLAAGYTHQNVLEVILGVLPSKSLVSFRGESQPSSRRLSEHTRDHEIVVRVKISSLSPPLRIAQAG